MILPIALLALIADSVVSVPPSQWKALDIPVSDHGTLVDCEFEVKSGSRVQVMFTDREQALRFDRGRSFQPLQSSGFVTDGHFRVRVQEAGNYVLLIDNRIEGRFPAEVHIRLNVIRARVAEAQELPPERRRAVVALSILFFGLIVTVSATQFLRQHQS